MKYGKQPLEYFDRNYCK